MSKLNGRRPKGSVRNNTNQPLIRSFFVAAKRPIEASSLPSSEVYLSPPRSVEEKCFLTRQSSLLVNGDDEGAFDEVSDTSFDTSVEVVNVGNPMVLKSLTSYGTGDGTAAKANVTTANGTASNKKRPPTLSLLQLLNSQPRKVPRLRRARSELDSGEALTAATAATAFDTSSTRNLSEEQKKVILTVLQGNNVFYTGSAGTGKSVVLHELVTRLRHRHSNDAIGVTASTGLAAMSVGGMTLHKYLGIGLGHGSAQDLFTRIKRDGILLSRWRRTKVLIIDEISMIDGRLFTKLEQVARLVLANNKPFGGIQIVCCGDFFQLPPVSKGNDVHQYCFQSEVWNTVIKVVIDLKCVFRQKGDDELITMLNAVRTGHITKEIELKFKALQRDVPYDDGIEPVQLFPTRNEVKRANEMRLAQLSNGMRSFIADDECNNQQDSLLLESLMCEKELLLKEGAQVMFIQNQTLTIVNGTQGTVLCFMSEEVYTKCVQVYFMHDKDQQVENEWLLIASRMGTSKDWTEQERKVVDSIPSDRKREFENLIYHAVLSVAKPIPIIKYKHDGYWNYVSAPKSEFTVMTNGKKIATRHQIPLILLWAMSIHKAQGQTLERVRIDLRRAFEVGQVYVALSRATNQKHLQVINFESRKITVSPAVKEFYQRL